MVWDLSEGSLVSSASTRGPHGRWTVEVPVLATVCQIGQRSRGRMHEEIVRADSGRRKTEALWEAGGGGSLF